MKPNYPYQPFLLRLLHGLTALFLLLSMVTAIWTYSLYDGRWGQLPLPSYDDIEGIHGTFGLYTLLIFPAFVVYAFHRGQQRLVQSTSFMQLTQVGKPIWWYTLSRLINTLTLVGLTLALFSGKMMDETWLPQGELTHFWYYAHLISWGVMAMAIAMHVLIHAKVGGLRLLLSMFRWQFHDQDNPKLWGSYLSRWWQKKWLGLGGEGLPSMLTLPMLETVIFISLAAAWAMPFFK